MASSQIVDLLIRARDTSSRVLRSFGGALSGLRGITGGVTKAFGLLYNSVFSLQGLLVGVGVAALAADFNELSKEVSETIKWSDRLGLSVKELSAINPILKESGIEMEDFADVVKTTAERMLEFQEGSGGGYEFLTRLGVSAVDANGKLRSHIDVLADVADAFQGNISATEKAAIASELFGDVGVKLIPILNRGGDAIRNAGAEAERLGVSYDRLEANYVAGLRRSLTDLNSSIDGVKLPILIGLSKSLEPVIRAITEQIIGVGKSLRDVGSSGISEYIDGIIDQTTVVSGLLDYLGTIITNIQVLSQYTAAFISSTLLSITDEIDNTLSLILGGIGTFTREANIAILEVQVFIQEISNGILEIATKLIQDLVSIASNGAAEIVDMASKTVSSDWVLELFGLGETAKKTVRFALGSLGQSIRNDGKAIRENLGSVFDDQEGILDGYKEVLKEAKSELSTFNDSLKLGGFLDLEQDVRLANKALEEAEIALKSLEIPDFEGSFTDQTNKLLERIRELRAEIQTNSLNGVSDSEGLSGGISDTKGIESLNENMKELPKNIEAAKSSLEIFAESGVRLAESAVKSLGDSTTNMFMSMIDGSKTAAEAFRDFAKAIIMDITRMIVKLLVYAAIGAAIGFFIPGAGAIGGAAIGAGIATGGGGAFFGGNKSAPSFPKESGLLASTTAQTSSNNIVYQDIKVSNSGSKLSQESLDEIARYTTNAITRETKLRQAVAGGVAYEMNRNPGARNSMRKGIS